MLLPQQCYQLSTEFHFRSDFELPVNCPHISNGGTSLWEDDGKYPDLTYFDRMAQRASWDLGTCIPPEILGSNGIVTLRQSRNLRSLHLVIPDCPGWWHDDYPVYDDDDDDDAIDLSSFRQLRSLGWKGPITKNLKALSVALRSNSMHLQEFNLHFVHLEASWDAVIESDNYYGKGARDLGTMLNMDERSPRPYFPELRVLSLTYVPITSSMMTMADFSMLTSLTLRRCYGSLELLYIAAQAITINLQRLEFQSCRYSLMRSDDLREFILAFAGLEELFILPNGSQGLFDLLGWLAPNHVTLRKFVYHSMARDVGEDHENFEGFHDWQDLENIPFESKALMENPTLNSPFSRFDLECLGLSCSPGKLLQWLLQPFQRKTSLKLLHIRQCRRDIYRYESLGLRKPFLHNGGLMGLASSVEGDGMDQAEALQGLRGRFRRFLEWAFGLDGLPSLQIVAFGDFAVSDAYSEYNIIACRDTKQSTNFQIISPFHPKMLTILSEYRDVLGACPSELSIDT
ncbi:hypothetical protein GQX73_g7100 [Xylaria multiplex]|uniref:Uncharacterized protein n=1 Tax=Xylaria multiplex TaxID=323545 RepID=A0A7C8IL99_9PEZI|nr:hypothetical protein GQX73_g7100 [Xylaria multiplex]